MSRRQVVACLLFAAVLPSCDRLDQFALGDDESFCGQITLGSATRLGLSPRVQMRLRWDVDRVDLGQVPGSLSTFDAGQEEDQQRLLEDANLRPIAPLAGDPMSQLDLGDGRDRTFVYAVSPNEPNAESLMAFVSLRSDDAIEVRLIRPGRPDAEDPPRGQAPIFGLFTLTRQNGDCGY